MHLPHKFWLLYAILISKKSGIDGEVTECKHRATPLEDEPDTADFKK